MSVVDIKTDLSVCMQGGWGGEDQGQQPRRPRETETRILYFERENGGIKKEIYKPRKYIRYIMTF